MALDLARSARPRQHLAMRESLNRAWRDTLDVSALGGQL